MRRAMQDTVDVVGASAAAEGIDCQFAKGGTVDLVRSEAQEARARAELDEQRELGFGEDDLRWLGPEEAGALIGATGVLGATYTPHCAAIQPALLARGLADAVERAGVRLFEHTAVTDIRPATAGRGAQVGDGRRDGPGRGGGAGDRGLDADTARAAARHRPGVLAHGGHRAARRRLLGRGGARAAHHLRRPPPHDHLRATHGRRADRLRGTGGALPLRVLRRDLLRRGAAGAHLAAPDARPSCSPRWPRPASPTPGAARSGSRGTGIRRSGSTAPAAWPGPGATSATACPRPTWPGAHWPTSSPGSDTDLVHLPWVGHRSPSWEPEPLRWLGVNAGLWTMKLADRSEVRNGKPSRLAGVMGRLLGQ